jgi:ribosome-binding ATPase YchF (GTP1/OBG family)
LSHIREADMILMVIRSFEHPDVIHVENRVNPQDDEDILNLELILSDVKFLEKYIQNLEKDSKKGSDKLAGEKLEIALEIAKTLENNLAARTLEMDKAADPDLLKWRKGLNLLTDKPILRLANVIDGGKNVEFDCDLKVDILQEFELSQMTPEERIEMVGDAPSALDSMIVSCFKKLGLSTYFTAGPKEARAWTFKTGTKAPQAAGVIHSDFEHLFIRGEVVKFTDLVEAGNIKVAKEQGKAHLVGKDYVVLEGDVCEWILK